jgi:glycosyltransferase involved in cell wall biosynthesis
MENISVIIPVYNASQTIEQCLDSVLKQTFIANYQIIAINDGSTDSSLDKLQSYVANHQHSNFRFTIINQKNQGAACARNAGLLAATGDWVAFLDSDDRWLPDKIQIQIAYLLAHINVDMVAGIFGVDRIDRLKRMDAENIITIRDQVLKNYFSPPTVLFRRSILDKIGLFNPNMRHSEEGFFFNNMVYHGKCVLLNQKVAESITNKKRWGECGLSGNLTKMEQGELFNIYQAYKNGYIHLPIYLYATCFSIIKFMRRVFLRTIRTFIQCK